MVPTIIVGIVLVLIVITVWSIIWPGQTNKAAQALIEKQKVALYVDYAVRKGWNFAFSEPTLKTRFKGVALFGTNYIREKILYVFSGKYRGYHWVAFEYKNHELSFNRSKSHNFTVASIALPVQMPTLEVTRRGKTPKSEDMFKRAGLNLGQAEFFYSYYTVAQDQVFAASVMSPSFMECLTRSRMYDFSFFIKGTDLVAWHDTEIDPDCIERILDFLIDIAKALPYDVGPKSIG